MYSLLQFPYALLERVHGVVGTHLDRLLGDDGACIHLGIREMHGHARDLHAIVQRRLVDYAAERECDVQDLQIFNNAEVLMSIGVGGVSLPLPYLVSYRELQYSCSLVRRKQAPADAREDMDSLKKEMRELLNRIPDGGSK